MLNISGISNRLDSAYVDVVSRRGARVHARFELRKGRGKLLLNNGEVDFSENISDLEVRVWVGEKDEIILFGYSLNPL